MRETFILLRPETEGVQHIVEAVEMMAGRVLLSLPRHAIVALLPAERADDLRTNPAVRLVSAEEIAEDMLAGAPGAVRMAVAAWNKHLARFQGSSKPAFAGLPWDAPGLAAPDPPADIREMLRRREQDLLGNDS